MIYRFQNHKEISQSDFFFSNKDDLRSLYLHCLVASWGNSSPRVSHFCMSCEQTCWLSFVLDSLSKTVGDKPERQCFPLEQSAGLLLVQYNNDCVCLRRKGQALSLPVIKDPFSLGFLSCNSVYCVRVLSAPLHMALELGIGA